MLLNELTDRDFINPAIAQREVDEYVRNITANCSATISAFKACRRLLYTGRAYRKKYPNDITFLPSPTNRQPRQLSVWQQEFINNLLLKLKHTALRSNSIYTMGSSIEVEQFGSIYVIIPFDGFSYTWSKHFRFITPYLFFNAWVLPDNWLTSESPAKDWQKYFVFKKTGFKAALDSCHEILVHGRYVAINPDSDIGDAVLNKLGLFNLID